MKLIWGFIFLLLPLDIHAQYFLCIDGGGSKTLLQVTDKEGALLTLTKEGVSSLKIEGPGSNINTIGAEGFRLTLQTLLEGVRVGDNPKDLISSLPTSQVIAGMAGAGTPENKSLLISLFEELGIPKDNILVLSDAEMTLALVKDPGAILIAGTGSICLAKKEEKIYRVGGLGKVLGDEGSGYQIGLQALKAGIEDEYGWGSPTSLTKALKEHYGVSELKSLIPQLNSGKLSPSTIAKTAPIVFEYARQDSIAQRIIDQAAEDLAHLLASITRMANLKELEVHLWGGLFKGPYADRLIQKITSSPSLQDVHLKVVNQSAHNVALIYKLLS